MTPRGTLAYVAAAADAKVVMMELRKLEVVGEIAPGERLDGKAWPRRGAHATDRRLTQVQQFVKVKEFHPPEYASSRHVQRAVSSVG